MLLLIQIELCQFVRVNAFRTMRHINESIHDTARNESTWIDFFIDNRIFLGIP